MSRSRSLVARLALLLLCVATFASARASTLLVDGLADTHAFADQTVSITISGTPGKQTLFLLDVSPGPAQLFGQRQPLGFTPLLQVVSLGPMPASGAFDLPVVIPSLGGAEEFTLYMLAAVVEQPGPTGYDFSGGASLTLHAKPKAGPDQGTLVGRAVTLDGSSFATPAGELKPDFEVEWVLTQAPAGSLALVDHADQPLASLTPDMPGTYHLAAQVDAYGQAFAPSTKVRVWSMTTTPYEDGAVVAAPTTLTGTVEGPALLELPLPPTHILPVPVVFVDNEPVYVDPSGSFGPIDVDFGPGGMQPADSIDLRAVHADGSTAVRRLSVFQGTEGEAPSDELQNAYELELDSVAVALLGQSMESGLETVDLTADLVGKEKKPVYKETGLLGNVVFRMNVRIDSVTYDSDLDFALLAGTQVGSSGGIRGILEMYEFRVDLDIWGHVLNVPYNRDGIIKADPAKISVTMGIGVEDDELVLPLLAKNVTLVDFSFDLVPAGLIGTAAQTQAGQDAIREWLEGQLETAIANEVGNKLSANLDAMQVQQSLLPDLDADYTATFQDTELVLDGLALTFGSSIDTNVPLEGAPSVPSYRSTPAPPPVPSLLAGMPGDNVVLAWTDDTLCQLLAGATEAGLLEQTIAPVTPGGSLGLTAGELDALMPQAGFEHFGPDVPILLRTHATAPPIVLLTPGGPGNAELVTRNVEVSFDVDTTYGSITVLRASLDEDKAIDVTTGSDGTLDVFALEPSQTLSVVAAYPGSPLAFVPSGVLGVDGILGTSTQLIDDAQIPSLLGSDVELQATSIVPLGPTLEYLATFGVAVPLP